MEEEFEKIDKENSWSALYQYIRSKAKEHVLPHKEARKATNVHLNRYKDVYPYDHSRICLQRADTNYINASLVPVPEAKRSYILTQGPLPTTISHFWAMVWEQKSKAIVMLNRIVEKNIVKCHKYWPSHNENELILEDVNLKVTNQKEEISTNYVIRHLLLTDLETNESRIIYHFHYVTWPDFGVPESPEQFLNFLHIVKEKGVLDDITGPPVVHCSAGIGRSGTFCLVDSSLIMIKEAKNLDISSIKNLLLEMRRYRLGLIQTADQLRFSYLAIIEGAKSILRENEQPSLPLKQKMAEMLQDKQSTESSSEDTESESSETTSEESVSSSDEDVAFEDKIDSTVEKHHHEIQNYIEVSKNDTVESESSDESESTLDDESSDMTETELDHDKRSVDDTKMNEMQPCYENSQAAKTNITCENPSEQHIGEISCKDSQLACKDPQDKIIPIYDASSDDHTHPLQASDLPQKSIVCSLNDITEVREAVNSIETFDGMETVNETLKENQTAVSNNVHFQDEINAPINSMMQPITEHLQNLSEQSESSKASLDESSEINLLESCDDGKQCLVSNKCSFDKLSNPYTELLSNEDHAGNEDDDVGAGMMSRHLEFYQNGDIHSAKEHKYNLSDKNSQSQKDRNAFCDNIKNNEKLASQCNYRSSSCPRQLPSISSKLLHSRIDSSTRKRRNSTESGNLFDEDDTAPLKFKKMHKDHRDAESQIVEELALVEDTYETSCHVRPKDSVLRSKR